MITEDPKEKAQVSSTFSLPKSLKLFERSSQADLLQRVIDQILATNPVSPVVSPTDPSKTPRRQKIYCDKWIHEGVCAFTQLGCKYKHEMPMDKATQMSLGLNHGLPAWYKRAHSVQLRPEGQGSPPQGAQATFGGPWRREPSSGVSVGHGMSGSPRKYS